MHYEKIVASFFAKEDLMCLKLCNNNLILGGGAGKVYFLELPANLDQNAIKITTIGKVWDYERKVYQNPATECPACGYRFEPPLKIIEYINQITKKAGLDSGDSPVLSLPDKAWDNPGLTGDCPSCLEKLKFKPFVSQSLDLANSGCFEKDENPPITG